MDFLPLAPQSQQVIEDSRFGHSTSYHFKFGAPLDAEAVRAEDGAICLLTGSPYLAGPLQHSTLEQVKGLPHELQGGFAGVALTADGYLCGLKALSGELPVYYREWDGGFAISNRLTVLLALQGEPALDQIGLSSLVSNGYIYGRRTSFEGISKLLPGEVVSEKAGEVVVHRPDLAEFYKPLAYSQAKDEILRSFASLDKDIRSLEGHPAKRVLPLSGGKDSRLIAGMIKHAGMSDTFDTFTNGVLYSPDVMSAKLVAEEIGLRHKINRPRVQWSSVDVSRRILNSLVATEGQVSLYDAANIGRNQVVSIGGHQNGLRDTYFRQFNVKDNASAETIIDEVYKNVPANAHRLLSKSGEQMAHNNLRILVEDFQSAGCPVGKIPVTFMWQIRTGGWVSVLNGSANVASSLVNPLLSSTFMKLACSLPDDLIEAEAIHFILMNEASQKLTNIPFADQNWRKDLPQVLEKIGYKAPSYRPEKEFRSSKIFVNASNPYLPNVALESYKLLSRLCVPTIMEYSDKLAFLDITNIETLCREDAAPTLSRMISQKGVFLAAFLARYGRDLFRRSKYEQILSEISQQSNPDVSQEKPRDEDKIAFLEKQIEDYETALIEYCKLERETRKDEESEQTEQSALRHIDIANKTGLPITYRLHFYAPGQPDDLKMSAPRELKADEVYTFGIRAQGRVSFVGQSNEQKIEKSLSLNETQMTYLLALLPVDVASSLTQNVH